MANTQEDKGSLQERGRDRSPPFPFIPLGKAIERARAFEAHYKKSAGRVSNVLPLWEYTAKSSGGQQTIGALKAYGLIEDEGSGAERKIKLTELALRILKDERPGKREEGIKEAALKPKPIAEHWSLWGNSRPPDAECRSELTLERGYTEDAAIRFLRVYDETINFSKLGNADSSTDKADSEELQQPGSHTTFVASPAFPTGQAPRAQVMPERIVFAQEIDPPQALKVLVTGAVDEAVLDALEDFVQFQRLRLKRSKRAEASTGENIEAAEGGSSTA